MNGRIEGYNATGLPLPWASCLVVEVGSTAHGTGIPGGEDFDECCVVMESERAVFGLGRGVQNYMQRTQSEGSRSGPGDVDRQVYSLREFLRLAAAGNPSIMVALFGPVLGSNEIGVRLRELSGAFIGAHMIPRFRGYMHSQGLRLLGLKGSGHGARGGGRRDEVIAQHGWDTKYAMHAARLGFQCIELCTTGQLILPTPDPVGGWLRALRRGAVSQEEWWETCHHLDAQMRDLMATLAGGLRLYADVEAIESFSTWAHLAWWESSEYVLRGALA